MGAPPGSATPSPRVLGLDYLYWWASHSAEGINFHTGGYVPGTPAQGADEIRGFWNADDGLTARPLAYALKAFALAADGRLAPVTMTANPAALNLRAYAVLAPDHTLSVVLITRATNLRAVMPECTLLLWLDMPVARRCSCPSRVGM